MHSELVVGKARPGEFFTEGLKCVHPHKTDATAAAAAVCRVQVENRYNLLLSDSRKQPLLARPALIASR